MRNLLLRSLGCLTLILVFSSTHAQTDVVWKQQEKGWSTDLVIAKWKTGDMIYDLKKDGASIVTISGRECPGTWVVKGSKVLITPKKLKWKKEDTCSKTRSLDIISVSAESMDISDPVTEQEIHLAKQQ